MSHALLQVMDPGNPRWESPETRLARQKTLWSIITGVAAGAALTTMIVVSCLDRDRARREPPQEPAYVETMAAPPPAPVTSAPPAPTVVIAPVVTAPPAGTAAVEDSTGGPTGRGAPAGTTSITSARVPPTTGSAPAAVTVVPPATPVPQAVPSGPRAPTDTSSGIAPAAPSGAPAAPSSPPAPDAAGPPGSAPAPQGAVVPEPTGGAGRFITDAPPWAGSAFTENPDAGAGRFPPPR